VLDNLLKPETKQNAYDIMQPKTRGGKGRKVRLGPILGTRQSISIKVKPQSLCAKSSPDLSNPLKPSKPSFSASSVLETQRCGGSLPGLSNFFRLVV
jgi:hypothetical protein